MSNGMKSLLIFWGILASIFVLVILPILINPVIGFYISLINMIIFMLIAISIIVYNHGNLQDPDL